MSDKPNLDASNKNSSRQLFEKRSDYNSYAVKTAQFGTTPTNRRNTPALKEYRSVKDFSLDNRSLIGRVDLEHYSLMPRTEKIKNITNSENGINVFCLDFVANAFDDMVFRYEEFKAANRIYIAEGRGEDLNSIKAQEGFVSSTERYFGSTKAFYRNFINNLSKQEKNKIRSLRDFADLYLEAQLSGLRRTPYFLSDYVKSPYNSQMTSGLAVEISTAKYDNDSYKVDNFLRSPNFLRFINLAQEYGFMIDKQIPWRLVADINSKAMKRRMQDLGVDTQTTENILYNYYTLVDFDDFILMVNDFYTAYNFFVKKNMFANKDSKFQSPEESPVIFREPIEIMKLSQIPLKQWVEYYIRLKNKSSNLVMKRAEINRIIALETEKVNLASIESIITSINRKFNFTPLDQGSATYKQLQVKLKESESLTDPLQQIKDFYVASLMNQY